MRKTIAYESKARYGDVWHNACPCFVRVQERRVRGGFQLVTRELDAGTPAGGLVSRGKGYTGRTMGAAGPISRVKYMALPFGSIDRQLTDGVIATTPGDNLCLAFLSIVYVLIRLQDKEETSNAAH